MSNDSGGLYLWVTVGFFGGLYSFFKGFRIYREYRVVEDTPEIPIRSMAMGLVRIHGKAVGEQRSMSPVTKTPCFFYKVDIEKWKTDSRGGGSWSHYKTDADGVKFCLEDASGRVLVDAHDAEYDLEKNDQREVGHGAGSFAPGATDEELRSYVSRVEVKRVGAWVKRGLDFAAAHESPDPIKAEKQQAVMEFFQQPAGIPESFLRIMERSVQSKPQQDPGKEQARLALLDAFQHPFGSPEFKAQVERAATAGGATPEERQKVAAGLELVQQLKTKGLEGMRFPPATGRYRFTEYCILPGHWYDVTGTCAENPKDGQERNLIMKGEHEPTFLISYRGQKEVETTLRRRAAWMVFGGAVASLVCLGILLTKLGWF